MKILNKVIRKLYLLIWFLLVFLFVSPNAYASVNINGTDFVQSPQVNFYDNSGGVLTSVGAMYRSSPYEQWVSSSNISTNGSNSDGANIALTVNSSFVSGYTYALSVLIGMEGLTLKASNSRVCIAENLTNASSRYSNSSSFPCTTATAKVTHDGFALYTTPNGNSFQYGVLTLVFTADFTAPSITFAYQSVGSNYSAHTFGGYHLDILAQPINGLTQQQVQNVINNSGLATANSVAQVQQSITQVQQELSSIDNTLSDSSVDSSDNSINDLKSKIPTNSVISDLLLLPVRFLQNFVNALGSSCSQFNLGALYGTNLYMPCINIENYLGSGIWTTIDLIISGLFIYSLRKKFIEIYENLTNLRNGGNEID